MAIDIEELRRQFRERMNPEKRPVNMVEALRKEFKEKILKPIVEEKKHREEVKSDLMEKPVFICYVCGSTLVSKYKRVIAYDRGLAICPKCDV